MSGCGCGDGCEPKKDVKKEEGCCDESACCTPSAKCGECGCTLPEAEPKPEHCPNCKVKLDWGTKV